MQFLPVLFFVGFAFGGTCLGDFRESQNNGGDGNCDEVECFQVSFGPNYQDRTCINKTECGAICPGSEGVSNCFKNYYGENITDQYEHLCAIGDGCPLTKFDRSIEYCTYPSDWTNDAICGAFYRSECQSNSNCYWNGYACRDKALVSSCYSLSGGDCSLIEVDGVAACINADSSCRRRKCSDYSVGNCPSSSDFPYCELHFGLLPEEGVGACVSYGFPLGNCGAYNFSGACEADKTIQGGCAWMKVGEGEPYCGAVLSSPCEYFITSKCNEASSGCLWNRGRCERVSSIVSCDELDSNNCGQPGIIPCVPEAGECRRKTCDDSYADLQWNTFACVDDPTCQWIYAYSGEIPVLGESAGKCVSTENMGGCASYKHPHQCLETAGCLFVNRPGFGDVCVAESTVTDCAWIKDNSLCNQNNRHSGTSCVWQTSACVASPCGSLNAASCASNSDCLWVKNKGGDGGLCVSSSSLVSCEQYQNGVQCEDSTKGCTWTADYPESGQLPPVEKCVSLESVGTSECRVLTKNTQCTGRTDCLWTSVDSFEPVNEWLNSQFGGHCTTKCSVFGEEGCGEKFECRKEYDGEGIFASCVNPELLYCADEPDDYMCRNSRGQDRPCAYDYTTEVCRQRASTCGGATSINECGDIIDQDCYWDYSTNQCEEGSGACEERDAVSCGHKGCYFSSSSLCLERTNNCDDYEVQWDCKYIPLTEAGEYKCYWEQIPDADGNIVTEKCKEITNTCEDYKSYTSCVSSSHAVKCYFKNDGVTHLCLPISPRCTATNQDDCGSSNLCEIVYLDDTDYTKFKCTRRQCSSYASNPEQCQMFDDCASHSSYPYCSEIPDPTPLVPCDGGLSESECAALGEAVCEWKGTGTGCSYSCGSRRSEWSCTSQGCAFILPAYAGNGKCVNASSVACSDFKNRAQCDASKDARGKLCIFARSLAAGASDTDFVCGQISPTCAGASTYQECDRVIDPSAPVLLGDGRTCEWDWTNNVCKHLGCSYLGSSDCGEFDSCYYDYEAGSCVSVTRENCDLVAADNCPKVILTGGGKCHFSDGACKPLDLSGLSACNDGDIESCDYINLSGGGSCYWDGSSCETLPPVCNGRSASACTREHPTGGCYVPSTGAPPCATITPTCADYTSETDCEKYVVSSTDSSYSLCYWRTSGGSGQCVTSNPQLCTARDKDDCKSSGLCIYDDINKKCKHYGCGTYTDSEECGLIYGCEYVDSTCRSTGNEITKCADLSGSECVSGSELAQLDCVVDETGTGCRQKNCEDIVVQDPCNDFVPPGGGGRCVWTKGAAEGNPGQCVLLGSVSSCDSFVESSTCNLLDACFWNVVDESKVCLNKSAVISCSSVNRTHCGDITNMACFAPEEGKTCVEGKCTDISGTTSDKKDSCSAVPACSWIYLSNENTNSGSCVFRNEIQCSDYISAVQCDESVDAQEKRCVHASPYTNGEAAPAVCKVLSLSCADATSERECGLVGDKVTPIDGCKWDVSNHKCRNFVCADFTTPCPDSCLSMGATCASFERSSCDLENPNDCAKIILPEGGTCHYSGGECRALDKCDDGDSTNCNKILTSGKDGCYWYEGSCEILPKICQNRPEVACIREHPVGCYFSSKSECREKSSLCSEYLTESDCGILKSDIAKTAFKCFWNSGAAVASCVEASKGCASAVSQPDCSSSGLCVYSGGTCHHEPCSTYIEAAACAFAGCEYSLEFSTCGDVLKDSKACSEELDADSCKSKDGCVWNEAKAVCSQKSSPESEPKKSNAGIIAGAVVGSVVVLVAVVAGVIVLVLYLKKLGPFKKGDTVEEGKGANEKSDVEMTTKNPISKK